LKKCFKILKFLALVGLLGITCFLTLSIIINISSQNADFFFPTHEPNKKIIHITYPSIEPEKYKFIFKSEDTPTLNFNFTLQYDGILTENTKVNITSVGVVHKLAPIYCVMVGFEQAQPENGEMIMPNLMYMAPFYSQFDNTTHIPAEKVLINDPAPNFHDLDGTYVETIYWDEPGEYSPYITINYVNGTTETILYPKQRIHVTSQDIVLQQGYARTNTWISLALFIFTIVTILPIITSFLPKSFIKKHFADDEETYKRRIRKKMLHTTTSMQSRKRKFCHRRTKNR